MTNKEFYSFCRDRRNNIDDASKEIALREVYGYMRECGVTRGGVNSYIEHCKETHKGQAQIVAAFEWLRNVFDRKVSMQPATLQGQETLF